MLALAPANFVINNEVRRVYVTRYETPDVYYEYQAFFYVEIKNYK